MKDLNKWKQNIKLLLLTFKKLYLLQMQIYRERRNREIHSEHKGKTKIWKANYVPEPA